MESENNLKMNISESNENNVNQDQEIKETKQVKIDFSKEVTTNLELLVNFKRIFDVCVSRGAFKSEELSQVGSVIDNLNNIIRQNVE